MKVTKEGKAVVGASFVLAGLAAFALHTATETKLSGSYGEKLKLTQATKDAISTVASRQEDYRSYVKLFTGPDWGYAAYDALPKVEFERYLEKLEEGTASNSIVIGPAYNWAHHVAMLWYDRNLNYESYVELYNSYGYDEKPLTQERFEAEWMVVYVQAPTDKAVIVAQEWYAAEADDADEADEEDFLFEHEE